MSDGASRIAQNWHTVDQFLDRAERVLSSEIAKREDLATVGTTMQIVVSLTDMRPIRIEQSVPNEAEIESAFGRVRPLFAEGDAVFHGRAMKAIKGLAQGAPAQVLRDIKQVQKAWNDMKTMNRWYMAGSSEPLKEGHPMRGDREIAIDFLYGDFIHSDADRLERLKYIPRRDRLLAAVVWVADSVRLTYATKQMIIDLGDAGHLAKRVSS